MNDEGRENTASPSPLKMDDHEVSALFIEAASNEKAAWDVLRDADKLDKLSDQFVNPEFYRKIVGASERCARAFLRVKHRPKKLDITQPVVKIQLADLLETFHDVPDLFYYYLHFFYFNGVHKDAFTCSIEKMVSHFFNNSRDDMLPYFERICDLLFQEFSHRNTNRGIAKTVLHHFETTIKVSYAERECGEFTGLIDQCAELFKTTVVRISSQVSANGFAESNALSFSLFGKMPYPLLLTIMEKHADLTEKDPMPEAKHESEEFYQQDFGLPKWMDAIDESAAVWLRRVQSRWSMSGLKLNTDFKLFYRHKHRGSELIRKFDNYQHTVVKQFDKASKADDLVESWRYCYSCGDLSAGYNLAELSRTYIYDNQEDSYRFPVELEEGLQIIGELIEQGFDIEDCRDLEQQITRRIERELSSSDVASSEGAVVDEADDDEVKIEKLTVGQCH